MIIKKIIKKLPPLLLITALMLLSTSCNSEDKSPHEHVEKDGACEVCGETMAAESFEPSDSDENKEESDNVSGDGDDIPPSGDTEDSEPPSDSGGTPPSGDTEDNEPPSDGGGTPPSGDTEDNEPPSDGGGTPPSGDTEEDETPESDGRLNGVWRLTEPSTGYVYLEFIIDDETIRTTVCSNNIPAPDDSYSYEYDVTSRTVTVNGYNRSLFTLTDKGELVYNMRYLLSRV